jgi:regulator of RNase E activity RraB
MRQELQVYAEGNVLSVFELLHDFSRLCKVAYVVDTFAYLKGLNLALQGKSTTEFNVQDKVNAAIMKIGRWVTRLDRYELDTFKTLNHFVVVSGEELEPQVIDMMKEHLMGLKSNFHSYFPDPDPHMEWVQNPFATYDIKWSSGQEDSLIDLVSDGTLKSEFLEKYLTDFWLHIRSEFPTLADTAVKYLMPFATIYFCEVGLSVLVDLKTKKRHGLEVEDD